MFLLRRISVFEKMQTNTVLSQFPAVDSFSKLPIGQERLYTERENITVPKKQHVYFSDRGQYLQTISASHVSHGNNNNSGSSAESLSTKRFICPPVFCVFS